MEENFSLALIKKLKKILKKNRFEIFLVFLSFVFFVITFVIYFKSLKQEKKPEEEVVEPIKDEEKKESFVFIDVSGAVKNPGLYKLNSSSRLKQAVDKAGGLNDQADVVFFQRNFNLAQIINDQEKIYIPTIEEVNLGLVETQIIPYQTSFLNQNGLKTNDQIDLISINSGSAEELDRLPGVGPVTAQKIIDNRPYSTIDDLLNKKIVNKSTFEKIKGLITIE